MGSKSDERLRLQRHLAECGVCSRRAAEKLITAGRVSVNDRVVVELGTKIDPAHDRVQVDGCAVIPEEKQLYLLHKPIQCITTMEDPRGRHCVGDLLRELPCRVFPVGRLDADVSGLLLLTNDGAYAERLLHPRFEVMRTYLAVVRGTPSPNTVQRLLSGVALEDGLGAAARLELREPNKRLNAQFDGIPPECCLVELSVREGRKHFVKRLLASVGHPVEKLTRIAFGPYELSNLQVGQIRRSEFRSLEKS